MVTGREGGCGGEGTGWGQRKRLEKSRGRGGSTEVVRAIMKIGRRLGNRGYLAVHQVFGGDLVQDMMGRGDSDYLRKKKKTQTTLIALAKTKA